jgi:hypothetical protein
LRFVIIPAVVRGLLLLFLLSMACAAALAAAVNDVPEDAARALAKVVAARLGPNETAHVTTRNVSSLGRADAMRLQAAFEQAIRKRVRNPVTIEITLTISENIRGFLLVTDLKREEERLVDMQPFQLQPQPAPPRPAMTLNKKLLWEQASPVLDVALMGEQMLVLDTTGVTRYERRDGKWLALESAGAPSTGRDPRGRINVDGTATPFEQTEPQLFSEARIGSLRVAAETDGRTRIFDANGTVTQTIDDWGSDVATINTCAGPRVAASGPGDRESTDTITLYELAQGAPVKSTTPIEFPGPVTALWPSANGAMVVARNLSTHTYEAYALTADCGR